MTDTYYDFAIDYFQDEDGVFTAEVPDLPGCVASGTTLDEAFGQVKTAIESCLQARKELDLPVKTNRYTSKNSYRTESIA